MGITTDRKAVEPLSRLCLEGSGQMSRYRIPVICLFVNDDTVGIPGYPS